MTGDGLRVLVVEDEAMIAMLLEDTLLDTGFTVAGMASGLADALDKARTLALDVALLDVNLGGELSYPVAAVLRGRGIPFVFATGYGTAGLPAELRGTPVLAKPFRQEQLLALLRGARG